MARLYLRGGPQPVVLTVEQAVGRGGANRRVDVLLVQFFLYVTAQASESSWGWGINRAVPKPTIDGVHGPITQDWINRFQKFIARKPERGIITDGRVDPILLQGSGIYVNTMYMLNVAYYMAFGADAIVRIDHHPLMPWELARTFSISGGDYDAQRLAFERQLRQ
jgi:hypothetical protein